ncbi:hypothetical protein AB0B27_07400 [Micromonospora rifamycinica]|uniref:hypothetical protein n=1 Tax=Micromonospora rifamycinica TaxID=291594 RepID=UPI0033C18051
MIALRLARALVMAAAGAAVTLAQLNLPSARFWEQQVLLQWASVAALSTLVIYDAFRSLGYAIQESQIRNYDNDLRASLSVVISRLVKLTGVSWDEITVRYYRRRGVLFWGRLDLVMALAAGAKVSDSQTSVRPGVGIAGTAFSEEVMLAEEWGRFVREATQQGPVQWAQREPRHRYGLSWGQLRRSDQPDGVVASPTFALDGQPDGCIVVSGSLKRVDLLGDEVRRTLDDLATVLDRLGPPPKGWWGAHDR